MRSIVCFDTDIIVDAHSRMQTCRWK